jgi:regulator of ribonuclease activity A
VSVLPFQTVDLCDAHAETLQICLPVFRSYGAHVAFAGQIETARCFEDNVIVKELLSKPGQGRVLVVDGGGSLRRALLGDRVAGMAAKNGWAGVVIHGCVRDIQALSEVPVGILALNHVPLASEKRGWGVAGETLQLAGVTVTPGHFLYADVDGVVLSPTPL